MTKAKITNNLQAAISQMLYMLKGKMNEGEWTVQHKSITIITKITQST